MLIIRDLQVCKRWISLVLNYSTKANKMGNSSIVLHSIAPDELKEMMREMIKNEFHSINIEMQRIIGEDDLVSTGSACRILGICAKVFRILVQDGHFTVFHHMKERRYIRAELLDYRNKYRSNRH